MKFNPDLKADIARYVDYVMIVEGEKDVLALKSLGFTRVYAIHKIGVALRERLREIAFNISKNEKVCILTDFDKKGKSLYNIIKIELQTLGVRLDSSFRGILLKAKLSHIEGLSRFLEKLERSS